MIPILEIKNISKKFRIGHEQQPYLSLRDSVSRLFSSLFGGGRKDGVEDFWALKDVSFNVYPGDSIGIIGKNGAGKSTLLKILSKITPPTGGKIISRGRIASLLEVGTGFHSELSGRENIFLNGSILGMKKREIQNKFDEIIDFSEVEKFLDTPLKHYSSGMQLRLAFAVAAFLEPEILIIDEVLAVGDAEFQRKCLGKMENVAKNEGRTILFVSHNLSQVQSLCSKGVLLEKGMKKFEGTINKTISDYISLGKSDTIIDLSYFPRVGIKNQNFRLEKLEVNNGKNIFEKETAELKITFSTNIPIKELVLGFSITDMLNNRLVECRSTSTLKELNITKPGYYSFKIEFNPNLAAGIYNFNIGARCSRGYLEYIPSVSQFEISPHINAINEEEWQKASAGIFITASNWEQIM